MIRLALTLTVAFARVLFRSRLELLMENLALRQQLAVFKQKRSRCPYQKIHPWPVVAISNATN